METLERISKFLHVPKEDIYDNEEKVSFIKSGLHFFN